jgi:coproporphyrinogen III oxidase-like Fe-S oxidoreductase
MVNSQIQALEQIRSPTRWINAVTSGNDGSLFSKCLSGDQCIREMVIMGLRLKTGLNRAWFARRLGVSLNDAIDLSALARLDNAGLTVTDDMGIRLSTKGYTLLDSVVKVLLP